MIDFPLDAATSNRMGGSVSPPRPDPCRRIPAAAPGGGRSSWRAYPTDIGRRPEPSSRTRLAIPSGGRRPDFPKRPAAAGQERGHGRPRKAIHPEHGARD